MGLRFRKSIKIAPGIRLNVGTKSAGVSFGGKGLRYSINSRTGGRVTASIPGTGLSYSVSTRYRRQYQSQAYQRRNELLRMQREMEKLEQQKRAIYEVQMFENQLEVIKSIHKECDETINWEDICLRPAPFSLGEKGPKELFARRELERFKPNIFQKWFKLDIRKRNQLTERLEQAVQEDQEDYANWQNLVSLATKVLSGDVDQYLRVIEEMSPLDDLSEFGSGFEFFIEEPTTLEVEFDVHSQNVIPTETKTLTKTGKVSVKPMTKTSYFDLFQDYVCSCVLRIARDMFAILPFKQIYIHAMDNMLNSRTGHMERVTILSVKIDRDTLHKLNFETIDCSDSMMNFEHNMKFGKTTGFKPVEKLTIQY